MRMSINGCESGKRKCAAATGLEALQFGCSIQILAPKSQTLISLQLWSHLFVKTNTDPNLNSYVPHDVQFPGYSCISETAHKMLLGWAAGERRVLTQKLRRKHQGR